MLHHCRGPQASVSREAFKPFTLHLASGDVARVPHPEFMWVHPDSPRTVLIVEDGGFRILDHLLIEEVRFTPNPGGKQES